MNERGRGTRTSPSSVVSFRIILSAGDRVRHSPVAGRSGYFTMMGKYAQVASEIVTVVV